MADPIKEFPLQYFTLRLLQNNTFYVKIPDIGYIVLDPIGPYDAMIHFVRDQSFRARKKKYIDICKSFMLWAFSEYDINRLTLFIIVGSNHEILAKLIGLTYEGTFRELWPIDGIFKDVKIFSILKGDLKPCL